MGKKPLTFARNIPVWDVIISRSLLVLAFFHLHENEQDLVGRLGLVLAGLLPHSGDLFFASLIPSIRETPVTMMGFPQWFQ